MSDLHDIAGHLQQIRARAQAEWGDKAMAACKMELMPDGSIAFAVTADDGNWDSRTRQYAASVGADPVEACKSVLAQLAGRCVPGRNEAAE